MSRTTGGEIIGRERAQAKNSRFPSGRKKKCWIGARNQRDHDTGAGLKRENISIDQQTSHKSNG